MPHSSAVLGARVGLSLEPNLLPAFQKTSGRARPPLDGGLGLAYLCVHPLGLRRYQQTGGLHFLIFSCYRRMQLLDPATRGLFERALEAARRGYCLRVIGYLVMPEHVHLLVTEPGKETLAVAVGAMKHSVFPPTSKTRAYFWQPRYYDFNVWSEKKRSGKLRYIYRNPVTRGWCGIRRTWGGAVIGSP